MGCTGSSGAPAPLGAAPIFASVLEQKYEYGRKSGEGGFASVRVVREKSSGSELGAKIIDLMAGTATPLMTARLTGRAQDEANLWRRLGQHSHIVRLKEAFLESGPIGPAAQYIMIMELCQASLLERLEQIRSVGDSAMARVLRESLFGIQHMHSVDVCHRDIKPANILLGGLDGETVKLCDFGLSVVVPKDGISLRACGSPSYMSPEVVRNEVFTTNTDVWSLGVTGYVVAYGCLPYVNPDGDVREIILSGLPEPSYAAVDESTPATSSAAACFLHQLLDRDRSVRCSAEQALHHEFVWPQVEKGGNDMFNDYDSIADASTTLGTGHTSSLSTICSLVDSAQ